MSASPAPTDTEVRRDQEQITFRFCRECSNMLYPKEDRENNQLMYACRTCQFSEPAVTSCVYRNQLGNTVGETAGVTQDVGADPTVGGLSFDKSHPSTCHLPSTVLSSLGHEELATLGLLLPLCMLCGEELVCSVCGETDPEEMIEDASSSAEFSEPEDNAAARLQQKDSKLDLDDYAGTKDLDGIIQLHDKSLYT